MKKYRVYGTATVTVTKEVWANNEEEAYEKAYDELPCLNCYVGNGGIDKLIGVERANESVDVYDDIEYNDSRVIVSDPDYFECHYCDEECEKRVDNNGNKYWWCENCQSAFDEDGDEIYLEEEEE